MIIGILNTHLKFCKISRTVFSRGNIRFNGKFNVRDTRDRERVNPFIIKNPNSNHP